jgi:hypothetical protein
MREVTAEVEALTGMQLSSPLAAAIIAAMEAGEGVLPTTKRLETVDPTLSERTDQGATKSEVLARAAIVAVCCERDLRTAIGHQLELQVQFVKAWVPANDERTCEVCERNFVDGAIPLNDRFPSGHLRPPVHALCRCSMTFQILR